MRSWITNVSDVDESYSDEIDAGEEEGSNEKENLHEAEDSNETKDYNHEDNYHYIKLIPKNIHKIIFKMRIQS